MVTKADELKTKITNCKRKITNFAKFIGEYSAERDFPILEKRINDLDRKFEQFNKIYTELEVLVKDPTRISYLFRLKHSKNFAAFEFADF